MSEKKKPALSLPPLEPEFSVSLPSPPPEEPKPSAPISIESKAKPASRPVRYSYKKLEPSDIVDVWRLYSDSLKERMPVYPTVDEDLPEFIRARIYQMLQSSQFVGFIARHGKRPVGYCCGLIRERPFGKPNVYLDLMLYFVDSRYRKQHIAETLYGEVFKVAKAMGVHHFESMTELDLVEPFIKMSKGKARVVASRLAGKITLE